MKLYFFDLTSNDLQHFSEVFSVVPYVTDETYLEILKHANVWNDGLYSRLRFNPIYTKAKTIDECDLAVIPFKFNTIDGRVEQYCKYAADHNKKVVAFLNDDDDTTFNLPANLVLFRTSLLKSRQLPNERAFPVIVPDHFPSHIDLPTFPENRTVAFCGYIGNGRLSYIERFSSIYHDTNLVFRNGFWAPQYSKFEARKTFYSNLLSSSFTFCIRGNGNFSYRFYEALSFGRIPIFINTDCVIPFSNTIDWSKHIISVNEDQIDLLPNLIKECTISPDSNRELWQTYFSAEGYCKNFIAEL